MLESISKNDYFCDYYLRWITVYKEGAIRKITMEKYRMTHSWIKKLTPNLKVGELTRVAYQELLNEYAKSHEKQTTMDFHHQLKCAILDAVDEGLIERDPTRKAIIKGKTPKNKKPKFLNQYELHQMLDTLILGNKPDWEWFILLVAKTGMRFSEALALTPADFDFGHQMVSVSKTYNYKGDAGGFLPTKNKSSTPAASVKSNEFSCQAELDGIFIVARSAPFSEPAWSSSLPPLPLVQTIMRSAPSPMSTERTLV